MKEQSIWVSKRCPEDYPKNVSKLSFKTILLDQSIFNKIKLRKVQELI